MLDTWQELLIAGLALIIALLIVYMIIRRGGSIRSKIIDVNGKPQSVRKTALTDGEIDRISERLAEKLDSHRCQYQDIIAAGSAMFEPLADVSLAMADKMIADGANGRIKTGRENLAPKLKSFRDARDARVIA